MRFNPSLLFISFFLLYLRVQCQNVFTVFVGDDGAFYSPQIVAATVGSIVNFRFVGTAHSVTQSNYEAPCAPAEGGFDSGIAGLAFQNSTLQNPMEWNLTITNDSIPIWYHCRATMPLPHCQVGMVGGINVGPPSTPNALNQSFNAFVSAAKGASVPQPTQTQPFSLLGNGATATAPPSLRVNATGSVIPSTTTSPTVTSIPSTPPPTQSTSVGATQAGPPIATIAGSIAGGCVGIVVICGLLFLLFRSRQRTTRLEAEKMSRDGSSWLSTGGSTRKLRSSPYLLH